MKRKADEGAAGASGDAEESPQAAAAPKAWDPKDLCDSRRWRTLKKGTPGSGPVVYW